VQSEMAQHVERLPQDQIFCVNWEQASFTAVVL